MRSPAVLAQIAAAPHDAWAVLDTWKKRIAALLAAVTVLAVAGRVASRRFLFPVHDVRPPAPAVGVVEHRLVASDGVPVRALELAADDGAPVVVHFHNNRDPAETAVPFARELRARGLGVVLVEYRGYGRSFAGSPTEEGLYEDAEAVLGMLAERGVEAARVVLWGTSLGTGVAAEMARRGRGGALVLVTPFTSIPDLVTNAAPFVPARALVPDRFETLAKAPAIEIPALVIHGDADEIVPYAMGERVAAALPRAELLRVRHGRHGDLLLREGARILEAIVALAHRASG